MTMRHPIATLLLPLSLLGLLAACGDDGGSSDGGAATSDAALPDGPRVLSGYQVDPPQNVAGVTMPDVSNGGAEFEMVAEPGHLLVVFFGYTHCPDVCPTTLFDLKKALRTLGDDAALIDVAMGTIDPERDTDEVITGYLQSFIPTGHALRTLDQEALVAATAAFGASFSVTPVEGGEPEVGHSPFMYLVDERGDIVLTWPFGLPSDAIAIDLDIMIDTVLTPSEA